MTIHFKKNGCLKNISNKHSMIFNQTCNKSDKRVRLKATSAYYEAVVTVKTIAALPTGLMPL